MSTHVSLYRDSISEPFRTGAGTIGTTEEQLSGADERLLISGVKIKADLANGDSIYVGSTSSVSSSNGYKLEAGQEISLAVDSLKNIWIEGGAASQAYSWIAQ